MSEPQRVRGEVRINLFVAELENVNDPEWDEDGIDGEEPAETASSFFENPRKYWSPGIDHHQ